MSKNQDISSVQLEDLPDEMIVQVLQNLDIKDLINCGMVSKRFRAIYRDESLWEKIRIFNKIVNVLRARSKTFTKIDLHK